MLTTAPRFEPAARDVFHALGSSVRLEIVELLSERDRTPSELSVHFGISQPAVLHHMKILGQAEIISQNKSGRCVEYALIRKSVIAPIRNYVRDLGFVHP